MVAQKDSDMLNDWFMQLQVQPMVTVSRLPKVEDNIGKPLSPYAVTKYVNELYADVFYNLWNRNYWVTLF